MNARPFWKQRQPDSEGLARQECIKYFVKLGPVCGYLMKQ